MDVSMLRKLLCVSLMCALVSSATSFCEANFKGFIYDLNSQCPSSTCFSNFPIQVDGDLFEKAVSSSQKNEYIAVLFYASWCPFSNIFQSKFSTLSSMYPQMRHMEIEQSSAMPSLFSRYGVHTVPSLLIVNQAMVMKYHGRKDLPSLITFYKRATGLDPMVDIVEEIPSNSNTNENPSQLWNISSLKETFSREPYLVLSVLFVLLRAFLYFYPKIASRFIALWKSYIPHLNLGIFGESKQLIGQVLHLIDVKKIWSKIKVCKTRNFHRRASNAQAWASSLASVSLGETSSSRVFPSKDL